MKWCYSFNLTSAVNTLQHGRAWQESTAAVLYHCMSIALGTRQTTTIHCLRFFTSQVKVR